MKVSTKATFSEYLGYYHETSGNKIGTSGHASIAEGMVVFHNLLKQLGTKGLSTGTKLRITIETLPKRKR